MWSVGLGELHDPDAVVDAVSSALTLREGQDAAPESLLVEYLAARKLLLVLDNCEHLVEPVAELSGTLLRACPELRILATSREPLGIGGEATFRVPSLTMPESDKRSAPAERLGHYEAVNLFAERAATAVPGFAVTENNQDVVAAICRRLDGLPLALELAAVRVRVMTVEQILHRVTDRYGLLTTGARDVLAMWGRLAVFSGSFELDAVEAICADPVAADQVVEVVGSLIGKSILIREADAAGAVRYRMLDTLRDYGTERLQETGEFGSLLRRHRE